MDYFSIVPEAAAIITRGGVYRQVQVYQRAGRLYAKYGAGFVRLIQGGSTSSPNIKWAALDTPEGSWSEAGGYVTYKAPLLLEAAE